MKESFVPYKTKEKKYELLCKKNVSATIIFRREGKKDLPEFFAPQTHSSSEYKNWISALSLTTCEFCRDQHGKVYYIYEISEIEPPVHDRCGCRVVPMKAVYFGAATQDGQSGADVYLSVHGRLPSNYIRKKMR